MNGTTHTPDGDLRPRAALLGYLATVLDGKPSGIAPARKGLAPSNPETGPKALDDLDPWSPR